MFILLTVNVIVLIAKHTYMQNYLHMLQHTLIVLVVLPVMSAWAVGFAV